MSLAFDVYFSFRSPYSYLAMPAIERLVQSHDVVANMRIVRPLAVREPDFFKTVNPMWPRYLMKDTNRVAQMNDIPYRWPVPDPIIQDKETRIVSPDQPYIMRVSRMGIAAQEMGKGFAFVRRASELIWNGETEGWNEGDHLTRCAGAVGLDGAALDAQIASDPASYDAKIVANEDAQNASGHWGVPLFVFEDEPFFGQDRIDALIWRMKQKGLKERS